MGEYPYQYSKVKIIADSDYDGFHIHCLVLLIFNKFFPDLIQEKRLSLVLPPLYGARKGKEFIPIYDVSEFEKLQKEKKGYTFQRYKGLGEMVADAMRIVLDQGIEYIIKFPKTQKIIDKLIKIITESDEKRKYLSKVEFNFGDFLKEVQLKGEK